MLANGDLGGGNDVLDVSRHAEYRQRRFALGDGDDTLTIHDGTDIIGTVMAGAGNDTFNTDIATNADLGAVQGFETLSKTGVGTLDINGPMSSDFTTVNVLGGTVNVTAGGSVVAQNTHRGRGRDPADRRQLQRHRRRRQLHLDGYRARHARLRRRHRYGRFVGGDISGLTGVDGGAGSDLLSFSGLDLQATATSARLANWERMELLNDSALTLGTRLQLRRRRAGDRRDLAIVRQCRRQHRRQRRERRPDRRRLESLGDQRRLYRQRRRARS